MDFKNSWRGILSSLASLKCGLILLGVIIVFSVLGTLIPQDLAPQEYIEKYGESLYPLLTRFHLTSLYHCWWFTLLLTLLGVNLLICTVQRIPFKKKSLLSLHASIIIILLGSVVTARFKEKGFMGIREEETRDFFISGLNSKKLGFTVRLLDFDIEYYKPQTHRLIVYVTGSKDVQQCTLQENESCNVTGSGYEIILKEYIPDFFIEEDVPRNKSDQPRNPAVLVEIAYAGKKEERRVCAKFSHSMSTTFSDLKIVYEWGAPIKEFKSSMEIVDGAHTQRALLRVNHPLTYKGFTFYQVNYDPDDLTWSGISVKKDPGVKIIFGGFVLLNLSILVHYYQKIKLRSGNDV